jgi:DNA-binding MarR family transcriptional regulator
VAIRLWLDGLHTTHDEQSVGVSLFKTNNAEDIEHLQDNVLFTLTALILHDEMSVPDLHAALNMSESSVRATCRHLEQKGLISENASGRYRVRLTWLPAVERLLRRRSFLHRS